MIVAVAIRGGLALQEEVVHLVLVVLEEEEGTKIGAAVTLMTVIDMTNIEAAPLKCTADEMIVGIVAREQLICMLSDLWNETVSGSFDSFECTIYPSSENDL